MVFALAVGSSSVRTTIPSASFSYFTADSDIAFLQGSGVSRQAPGRLHLNQRERSDALDDGGDAHAAADAERGEAAAQVAPLELVDEGAEDHRAGRTERVTHGDRTAVDVGDLVGDAQVAHEPHRDRGERLVDLEQV